MTADNQNYLKMPDDFSLEEQSYISATVDLGEIQSSKLEEPHLTIQLSSPKKKKLVKIQNVEITTRGNRNSLF